MSITINPLAWIRLNTKKFPKLQRDIERILTCWTPRFRIASWWNPGRACKMPSDSGSAPGRSCSVPKSRQNRKKCSRRDRRLGYGCRRLGSVRTCTEVSSNKQVFLREIRIRLVLDCSCNAPSLHGSWVFTCKDVGVTISLKQKWPSHVLLRYALSCAIPGRQ